MRMVKVSEVDRRFRITVYRPQGTAGRPPVVALDWPDATAEQLEEIRALLGGHLGPGFVAIVDGEVIASGLAVHDPPFIPAAAPPVDVMLEHSRRLTELAVQQHEYCYAELQRIRRDYEEDFAQERTILRTLRQRWLEWICDDKVRGEDALRYAFDLARSLVKGDGADERSREPEAAAAAEPKSAGEAPRGGS